MRIVITGASGNVGTALLRRLAAEGGHEVVGVVRRPPAEAAGAEYDGVDWIAADLTTEGSVPVLTEAMRHADAVVHLAWGFQPSHRLDLLQELGVGGTRRVLEAVAAAGVGHLVHMSSVGAYSPRRDLDPVDESYPTDGVPGSPYSTHKAAAERLLDRFETEHPQVTVARMRPGIIGQEAAGSALLRYALPAVVPARLVGLVPLLPVDRALHVPMVHADDVAAGLALALAARAGGPFNLAAEPVVTVADIGAALGARHLQVPAPVVRTAVSAAWHARLLPLDPGWIDLAYAVPMIDTGRARAELGWSPTVDAVTTLRETVAGMAAHRSGPTPVLRPRTVMGQVGRALSRGPVSSRREP